MSIMSSPEATLLAPTNEETIPVCAGWFGSWKISVRRRVLTDPQLADCYDRAAKNWNRSIERLGIPGSYQAMLQLVLASQKTKNRSGTLNVLDCGIGTGALSVALARTLPEPFSLEGVDLSAEMLRHAGSNLAAHKIDAKLAQADVRALPFTDGTFDLVMAGHLPEHLSNPVSAMKEIARVLKPGGILIASLTRDSWAGKYIQVRWHTHIVTLNRAENWFTTAGLVEAHSLLAPRKGLFKQISVVCTGRKPGGILNDPKGGSACSTTKED